MQHGDLFDIRNSHHNKKILLLEVIEKYSLKILILDETSDELAKVYLREKLIPQKKLEDTQHIAPLCFENYYHKF